MNFIETNREKIALLFGFILVLSTGFFAGYYYSQEQVDRQGIVIKDSNSNCTDLLFLKDETTLSSQINRENVSNSEISDLKQSSGKFVASKNSTIYHKVDCVYVKRIKDENKIFFNSAQEAESRGLKFHSGE